MTTALWSDLKTDEERFAFFLSGRAYETGVVCHSIQNDLAMAYHRLAEMQKELRRLDALVGELVEALSLIQPIQCDNLHHEKKHRHSYADSCPVKEWIDGVLAKAKEQT